MKLSELTHQLQRFHDLYPQLDPDVLITEVAYKSYDKEKLEPEFYCRTLQITCYELRTLVHLPSEQLFSERGPGVFEKSIRGLLAKALDNIPRCDFT